MKFSVRIFVILGSINIYHCLKCYQCTPTQECREAVECADPIFEILEPACGTETSSTGVRHYCVAHGNSKDFGCVKTGSTRTCVCQSEGCNHPGATESQVDITFPKPAVTQPPNRLTISRPITETTIETTPITRSSKNPELSPLPQYKPPLQCFDCIGCKTPTNLRECPASSTHCLSITTGDLVRRKCARFREQNGCTMERNNIGSKSEICYCDKVCPAASSCDSCNSSTIMMPSILMSIFLAAASTKLFS